jgi:arginine repressor
MVISLATAFMVAGAYSLVATRRAQQTAASEYRRSRVIRQWFPFLISLIESEEWIWLRRISGAASVVAGLFLLIAYFGLVE